MKPRYILVRLIATDTHDALLGVQIDEEFARQRAPGVEDPQTMRILLEALAIEQVALQMGITTFDAALRVKSIQETTLDVMMVLQKRYSGQIARA